MESPAQDPLRISILRVLTSQNETIDLGPVINEPSDTPENLASIRSFVLSLEDEDFERLLALINTRAPEKYEKLISMADTVEASFMDDLNKDEIENMCQTVAPPLIKAAREVFLQALGFGVNESDARVWAFDIIANAIDEVPFPDFLRTPALSWICTRVMATPPQITPEEIRANIQQKISSYADELTDCEEAQKLRGFCEQAKAKGYTFDDFWAVTSPAAAAMVVAMEDFIDKASAKAASIEEYMSFTKGDLLRSACLRTVIKRCWPE